MTGTWTRTQRPLWAWTAGVLLLVALGAAVWALLAEARQRAGASAAAVDAGAEAAPGDARRLAEVADRPFDGRRIGGIVSLPDGTPAAGATVTILRATTAWPEWQAERIDQAITGPSGTFEFRVVRPYALLVEFQHPAFAGGLEEVPAVDAPLRLSLRPGYELFGVLTNPAGVPIANARVALEAVIGDDRRVQVTTTSANGAYRFQNLPAGPVRLVARHESWQPATVPVVVIGDQVRRDLTFERPGMAPLRGRVVSVVSQAPIEGATVELLPANVRPGLHDTFATSTASDGTFLLAGLPRGNMRLYVRHPDHGAYTRTLAIGVVAADLALELPPRSLVQGQLLADEDGVPFVGGMVLQIRDVAGQLDHAVVAPDGRFRFETPLSPGWAAVRVLGDPIAFRSSFSSRGDVRIDEGGVTEVELDVLRPRVVQGRIVDDGGRPLAGAVVSRTKLLSESARSIGTAVFEGDFSRIGSQVARLFRDDRDEVLAVSDTNGRFVVSGQAPGALLVRIDLAGHGTRWLQLPVPSGPEPYDAEVWMRRGCSVTGRVVRSGRGLAGAAVTALGDESQALAMTGSDGSFAFADLLPGRYRLRARLPSLPSGSRERAVEVAPGQPVEGVVLQLEAGRTVRGVVSGSDGQPVPSALVTVRGTVGQTTLTDSSGDFLLELPDGDAELQVSLADRSRLRVVAVPIGLDRVSVQLDTPPTCTIGAQLAGLPGKQRLAGVLVRCATLDGDAAAVRSRWLDLDNGRLRWPLCPVGRVRLEFWSDGFAPAVVEREFVPNESYDLGEVLLETGAVLHGAVVDDARQPVANAAVWLGDEGDGDLFEPTVRTDEAGAFRIGGVTSRSTRLVVRAAGFAPRVVELELPRDVLSPSPLPVVLERGATIEVQVPRRLGLEGAFVQLRQGGRIVADGDCDDSGRAWFANRSAGDYTVLLPGVDLAPVPVEVPAGASVVRVRIGE